VRAGRPPSGLEIERLTAADDLIILSWSAVAEPPATLSAAEREVLAHIVRGESNADIARARSTSVRTVANQVASLLRKTAAESRFELIRRYAGAL
jgi:DNA-binding NarL/FixJ family response regulator